MQQSTKQELKLKRLGAIVTVRYCECRYKLIFAALRRWYR